MSKGNENLKLMFVVEGYNNYGGSEIIGIFDSYMKARRAVRTYTNEEEEYDGYLIAGCVINNNSVNIKVWFNHERQLEKK